MKRIDSHHHFWNPARGDYGWMPPDNAVLSRTYSPVDLAETLDKSGIDKTVLVQAAPSVEETEYLLGIADSTAHVGQVVGWVDFEDPNQQATLERLAKHPKFAGVRPMIQDLPDDNWMLREDVQWAYQAIIDNDLTFDCLGFPQHLENFHTLLTRYPEMRSVIDHCMKPQIGKHSAENFRSWADGMTLLANETTVYCKLSGVVTEADDNWSYDTLKPYIDHVITIFGAERVMWGSDWPVVRLRCEYEEWLGLAERLTDSMTPVERERLFAGTAREFYRL